MRKSSLTVAVIGCVLTGVVAYVAGVNAAQEDEKGRLVHIVLFKLKEDVRDSEAERLINDGYELLAKVPSVKRMHTGGPSKKPMARNRIEYDVALYCEFEEAKGLAEYIEHPLHQEYVARHREHWEEVQIVDFDAR